MVLSVAFTQPAQAKPPEAAPTTPVAAPPADADGDTLEEVIAKHEAEDAAAAEKAKDEKAAQIFCDRATPLGKQKLADDTAKCQKPEFRKDNEELCKKVKACVPLAGIKHESMDDAKRAATAPRTPPKTDAKTAATTPAPTPKGPVRIGGCSDGVCPEPAVYNKSKEPTKTKLATLTDTATTPSAVPTRTKTPADLTATAPIVKPVTEALKNNMVPETRDVVTNTKYYLQFCREEGLSAVTCKVSMDIIRRESEYNSRANPVDSGHDECDDPHEVCTAYGLGQYIDSTWQTSCSNQLNMTPTACMQPEVRGSAFAQAKVFMHDVEDEYQKCLRGECDSKGLDFGSYYYGVKHFGGSWNGRWREGVGIYQRALSYSDKVYSTAAAALGDNPADIAQITLTNVGNYITPASLRANTGGVQIGAYATPEQNYVNQLLGWQGSYGLQVASYNPYGAGYVGGYSQPALGSAPANTGILGGTLPVVYVAEDGTITTAQAPRECGGQVMTGIVVDSGLVEEVCVEPIENAAAGAMV